MYASTPRLSFTLLVTACCAGAWGVAAQAQQILIGQAIALSGGAGVHGSAIAKGVDAYIEVVNAAGGVRGQKIVIRRVDDTGDGKRAGELARELIDKEKVVALFSGAEGGPCVAITRAADERRVPVIGCAAGSPELREPPIRYSFPVRAAHLDEFDKLIDSSLSYGHKRIAFMHADSDTGRKHLANVNRLLGKRGAVPALPLVMTAKITPEDIIRQLAAAKPDAMFNHGSFPFYAKVIQGARKQGLPTAFLAINSGAEQMAKALGADARGMIFTQVSPYPWGRTPPIVAEYRHAFERKFPGEDFSFSSIEGFINAKVLVEGLKRAKTLTPDGITDALANMGSVDFGGFEVRYSKDVHEGSSFVDTVVVSSTGKFAR